MIEHLRARTSLYYKMSFFWKVLPLHNYTSWFLLSYRNTVVNISASVCVSVPRNKVCKNPSISKLALTVSPSPRRKAAPPPPCQTILFFCSFQHFPVKLLLFGIEVLTQTHSIIT